MKNRIITALITLPFIIGTLILPSLFPQIPTLNYLFAAIAIAALALGLFEYYLFCKTLQLKADASIGYLGAAGFFVAFFFDAPSKDPNLLLIVFAAFITIALITQTFRFQIDFAKMLTGIGVTVFGVIYIVFLGGYLIAMRVGFENRPNLSTKLLFFFFLVLMLGDVFALLTGKIIGKHKLAPKISPGKTWEGFSGGLLMSLIVAGIASVTFFQELPWFVALPLASVMNILGVLGDLAESAMKRGAGAKDAAKLLPGHGGLLDRLDSLLLNAPLLYYFAKFYFG